MDKKKRSLWSWLNPMTWIEGVFQLLRAILDPILRSFGMLKPPSTTGFENIKKADVDDAARLAAKQEAAVDAIARDAHTPEQMSPAAPKWICPCSGWRSRTGCFV